MNKQILIIVAVVVFSCGTAHAAVYTLSDTHLMDTTNFVDLDGPNPPYSPNTGTLHSRTDLAGQGVRYEVSLNASSGWASIMLGDGFDHPSDNSGLATGLPLMGCDFTAYSTYDLAIRNPSNLWFMANIYTNDGWTDQLEPDTFTEAATDPSGWDWIAPGTTQTFSLDLTSLTYQNHVSNIGLQIGANVTGDESWNGNMGQDVHFQVDVLPEPATILVSAVGLIGLVSRRMR
jgi:hypothetical protein